MRGRVVEKTEVLKIVDLLRQEYEVVAPFYGRGRDSCFDVVTDDNRDQVQIHIPNPYYPPKRYVLPHIERLMKAKVNGGLTIEPIYEARKRAIFGIRSCDVEGIYHLDRFFLGREHKDIYYEKHRQNLFLVNVVCTDKQLDIDDDCFCVCADTGPAARDHFDLQLMDLGDVFLAIAGTPKGEALFRDPIFKKATSAHVARRKEILNDVRKNFKVSTSWYAAAMRYITQGGISEETWEKIGNRCLECGGCTYECPTCTCFTMTERQVGPDEVERVRLWDSCALSGFTRMAGGHNPRKAVHDRRNRRFFRKLEHYFVQRELSVSCVGCGRCVGVCHGNIGMPDVVEIVRRASVESEKK
ncbi:MAG: 4Fe-4S dicluster domain-containing protein [Planctomycetota bacterium]